MLRLKGHFQKSKGFTLIELLMYLIIASLVLLSLFSGLTYVNNILKLSEAKDENLLNGSYSIEYIKNEILLADSIIATESFDGLKSTYEDIFDFVILSITYSDTENFKGNINYNYSTYYRKNNSLIRIAANKLESSLPKANEFSGYNQVSYKLLDMSKTKLNLDENTIELHLLIGDNLSSLDFRSIVYLEYPIEIPTRRIQ